MGEKLKNGENGKYAALGATIFVSGAALIILYMVMSKYASFAGLISKGLMIISPFIYGIVIAYLLDPLYEAVRRPLYMILDSRLKERCHPKIVSGISRGAAIAVTMLIFIMFLVGFGFLVIPKITESLSSLVVAIPARAQEIIDLIEEQDANDQDVLINSVTDWLKNSTDNITSWISDTLLPALGNYMTHIYQGLWSTVKTLLNLVIGLITSIYLMVGLGQFKAAIKRTVRAIWSEEKADEIIDLLRFSNKAFGGFISGKIIDSIIIGFLCFAVLTLLDMPYAVLVSVIVGITNVIPFFGPFIGAVPGALVILAASPMKMVIFLIVIFALQQFDGYVLGPKILGDSTGLSSFWVMFAIIVGSGMFGFLGMVFAVPVFAVIAYYFNKRIEQSLENKGLATSIEAYESGGTDSRKTGEDKASDR